MITSVKREAMASYHRGLPLRYDDYLTWLDEDERSHSYYIVSTAVIGVRPRIEWNEKGREIYDEDRLSTHAGLVFKVAEALHVGSVLAEHEYSPAIWFPAEIIARNHAESKVSFIRARVHDIDVNTFDGAFRVEDHFAEFLHHFIDYPFVLRYRNIDMFSERLSMILKITHHLAVDFVTPDRTLADQIVGLCGNVGLPLVTSF
jgi:hypothetical protein